RHFLRYQCSPQAPPLLTRTFARVSLSARSSSILHGATRPIRPRRLWAQFQIIRGTYECEGVIELENIAHIHVIAYASCRTSLALLAPDHTNHLFFPKMTNSASMGAASTSLASSPCAPSRSKSSSTPSITPASLVSGPPSSPSSGPYPRTLSSRSSRSPAPYPTPSCVLHGLNRTSSAPSSGLYTPSINASSSSLTVRRCVPSRSRLPGAKSPSRLTGCA
ncbi:uncharacterized protein PHACADRAFT_246579, partial [Phanerochaete carnosa HHB-10118-sp]